MTTRIAIFQPSEVFPFVVTDPNIKTKRPFQVGDRIYKVKVSSQRLILFKSNPKCVSCGIEGSFFALEQKTNETPHLNFYATHDGEEVLMTKDHIVPVSKGGQDHMANYQTMCTYCNQDKGKSDSFKHIPVTDTNQHEFPEAIEWPGRGMATRLKPRGMSDYPRQGSNRIYSTPDGFLLYIRREYSIGGESYQRKLGCKAQSKNFTSPSFATPEEAMAWIDRQAACTTAIPSEVEWPGVGIAKITAQKSEKNYTFYKTDNGALLQMNRCAVSDQYPEGMKWIAQYQGSTTKWLPSAKCAIDDVMKKISDTYLKYAD